MATVKVTPRSLTEAYKRREGDFSPNLVGLQFTDGASLFTFGNFQITTNLDNKLNKNFVLGGQWSDYYNLDNLNLSETVANTLVSNDIFVRLNFDPYNIGRFVYFGSFQEFIRITLEQIIQKWKGSVYLNSNFNTNSVVNTVLSFNYDSGNNTATFLIPKNVVTNNFQLIIDDNNNFYDIPEGEIYNIQRDYKKYVIWTFDGDKEYSVIGYTGSTDSYQYIKVQTEGNPFPSLSASTFGQINYHLKPNSLEAQLFFENLTDFEKVILNRLTTPIYTCSFDVPKESDGVKYTTTESFTWPVSDGYNIDITTRDYGSYVQKLLDAAIGFDNNKTDLVSRRFVSESIHEFDTNGGTVDNQIYGMKVSKLLRIYGREFDEVKKYIDGISFANVVTYDKLDNTSDELIKMMAKNLGFDVLLTVGTDNFNLLEQIKPSLHSPFSGYSRALSSKELDIELWRRLVINAWWLFKSKGTRKVIEFFFSLFKIPECMVTLNEYIYLAENRLDVVKIYDELYKIYELTGGNTEIRLSDYPMDDYGFPRVLTETPTNYFQMGGFWYNGGTDITTGNNPHIGPYDFGQSYFNQFECFVPNFNDYLTASTQVTVIKNYFNNYNKGSFIFDQNGLPVSYYGTGYANVLNNGLVDNVTVNSAGLTYVGGNNAPNYGRPSGDTYSMKISFTAGSNKNICDPCAKYQLTYGEDGIVYVIDNPNKPLTDQLCCKTYFLPAVTNTSICPKPDQLVVLTDNTVAEFSTKKSVSQSCCSKEILGFNVAWNGRTCVVPTTCPDPGNLELSTTDFGVILNNGQSVSQSCCSKEILGVDVFWNGKDCVQSTIKVVRTINNTTLTNTEILQASEAPTDISKSGRKFCYWCPPKEYTQTICSVDTYLATLTASKVISLAQSLGSTSNTYNDSVNFLINIYTPFFITYGCIIIDNQDNMIKDKACCELKGGNLISINGVSYCIKSNSNSCVGAQVDIGSNIWSTSTGNLLPQSCCNQAGQYWVYPFNLDNNNISLVSQDTTTTFLDIPGFTTANSYSYCSNCPNMLKEVGNLDGIFIYDSNNNPLPQSCCTRYGFNWNSNTNQCTKCPTVVNYGTPLDANVINDLNGLDLTQQCCTQVGGYYVDVNGQGNKCYICPPINSFNNTTGLVESNPNYQIINNEVTYLGTSLSQQCCIQYNTQMGNVTWNSIENKCFLNMLIKR